MSIELAIEGMHCDGCVKRVMKALERAGIEGADVEVGKARLESAEDASKAAAAITAAGYPAKVATS